MVSLIGIDPNSLVIDPAVSGGFLTEVLRTKWSSIDNEGKKLGYQDAISDETFSNKQFLVLK